MKKIILSIALLSVILVSAKNETPNNNFKITSSTYTMSVNAFCKLIQMGDYETVKSLIEDGIDVNKKSVGLTPLMYAARHNKAKITKLLINNGAKLKVKSDGKGFTALRWAELSNANDAFEIIESALENQKKRKRKNRK